MNDSYWDNNLFELYDITFCYKLGEYHVIAIEEVSLHIPHNSMTLFTGPSGSGKSTLLNLLGLIEPVQFGKVLFQNQDVSAISESDKNVIRMYKIGFIFQDFHLIPVLTVEENVSFFLESQSLSQEEINDRVHDTLNAVGLWEHRMKMPHQLSIGQMQRVAIARAVAKQPEVIIADEPTASLDQKNGQEIMQIFEKLVENGDVSVIFTSHDPMVLSYASHQFHLQDGALIR